MGSLMSAATVEQILRQIDQLAEPDREDLERKLANRQEAEWQQLAQQAREVARQRGIGQAEIDQAVDAVRSRP